MNRVCLGDVKVPGYDVSHYQPISIHAHMKAAGYKFCIIKAIQGTGINDPLFRAHLAEAQRQGMIVGVYNFWEPSQPAAQQAAHFKSVVGEMGPGMLGPIGDIEKFSGSMIRDGQDAMAYMDDVCGLMGRPDGGIYGSSFNLQSLKFPLEVAKKYWLWVAEYGVACPYIPAPWSVATMFQWTDGGKSNLDLDFFNGSYDQLKKLAQL